MSFGRSLLWSVIGLPIIWFVIDLLVALLLGPVASDAMIMGIETIEAIALAVSIIVLAVFIKHAMRLVRH
jgi:hypothetical protein